MNRSAADKATALEKIAEQIASCRRCRLDGVGKPVVGEGNPNAEIVFVGEAPGRKEAESGRPFVGRAGQWLRRSIRNMGLDERSVYFTSPIKYRLVRRKPRPADVSHGRVHVLRQLEIIDPKIVVLLGNAACLGVLSEHVHVGDQHGSVILRNGRTYLITYHPAAAARFPAVRKAVLQDFRKLKALAGQLKDRKSA